MTDKPKVWVLTREINDYNQDGEYFVTVWLKKPSIKQLSSALNPTMDKPGVVSHGSVQAMLDLLLHILDGGGRQDVEHEWYNLRHVEVG